MGQVLHRGATTTETIRRDLPPWIRTYTSMISD